MTIHTKANAAAGIAAATTTLSIYFTSLTSVTTASLITLISALVSSQKTSSSSYSKKCGECGGTGESRHPESIISKRQQEAIQKYYAILHKHLSSFKFFLEDAFLFVFTATWLLLAGVPYGILLFWRWTNLIYLRLRWGLLTDFVNGYDIIGTIDEPASKQVIMSLKVLKGPVDVEDIRSRCEKTVSRRDENGRLVFRKFFQYLDTFAGYYCWKPAVFDMTHHVRIMDGVDPDKAVSETEVMELLSEIANEQFAPGRSPWEILIIPKFLYNRELAEKDKAHSSSEHLDGEDEDSEKCGLVIRIHHGMGDGFSLMKLIMRDMAGEDPEKYKPPVKDPGKPWPWWYRIFAFFYILWNSPRCFYKEMSVKDSNPLHNPLVKVSGEKFIVWSEQINVKWLKELKVEMKCGMNSMLFGAVCGALRSYIMEQESGSSKIPPEITALIPAPAPNHPNNAMTNKFAIIMYPLESQSNDPRVRCAAIEKTGKHIANSPEPHVNLFLAQLIGVAPTIFSKFFIYNTQSTVVISNLPGPDRNISIWDKPLVETMFWLPNVGHSGISVSFLSYRDTLRIGMTVDKGIIPQGRQGARHLINLVVRDLEKAARFVGVEPKGHGISENLLFEPGVRRHNSEDELEELLLPDSSPVLPGRRRKSRTQDFRDTDSTSSSEDYGYVEEESLEDLEDDYKTTEDHHHQSSEQTSLQQEDGNNNNEAHDDAVSEHSHAATNGLRPRKVICNKDNDS